MNANPTSKVRRRAELLRLGLLHPRRHGLIFLDAVRAVVMPRYLLGEGQKLWHEDDEFLRQIRALDRRDDRVRSDRSAERKFFLRSLLGLVEHLPGDTAEAGVFEGAASWLICHSLADLDKTHYAFDSFEGLSAPTALDGRWQEGALAGSETAVRDLLAPFGAKVFKGWIPDCFALAEVGELCFAHIDVDIYEPTLESMRFFYPRMVPGGVILCDDYGFTTCAGAGRAVDEYMDGKPEKVIHVPTGQAFIVKR